MKNEKEPDALEQARKHLLNEFVRSSREGDGWPVEADEPLNDASRKVVEAMHDAHGEAWLGQINLHGEQRGKVEHALWKWDGSLVLNFAAAFVAPKFDEEVVRLIMERDTTPWVAKEDAAKIEGITKRVAAIGGITLVWT